MTKHNTGIKDGKVGKNSTLGQGGSEVEQNRYGYSQEKSSRNGFLSRHKVVRFVSLIFVLAVSVGRIGMTNLSSYQDVLRSSNWISEVATNQSNMSTSSGRKPQKPSQNSSASASIQRHRLEFVHIPKTGGMAVELEAARFGVKWGMCHFLRPGRECNVSGQKAPLVRDGDVVTLEDSNRVWASRKKEFCSWWHLPPAHFLHRYLHDPTNPFRNATLFTIIRNPYARVMSEYYYWSILSKWKPKKRNSPRVLNDFIKKLLSPFRNLAERPTYRLNQTGNDLYHKRNCHVIPQYHYVYDEETKVIPILIRFETLQRDFQNLMQEFEMPFTDLPKEDVRKVVKRKLTVSNMTLQTLRLIESVYEEDFREFGYKIISPELYPQQNGTRLATTDSAN